MTLEPIRHVCSASKLSGEPDSFVGSGADDLRHSNAQPSTFGLSNLQLSNLQPARSARPAIFVDRDGTINVEVNYLRTPDALQLLPGAAHALAALREHGFLLVGITNQAGIARGMLNEATLGAIHERLQAQLAEHGAALDAIYFCPHHPDFTGACACRKPLPGMLLQAAAELGIDLQRSWMVGDTAADLAAGHAAGCRSILVRTGYGAGYVQAPNAPAPEWVAGDIAAAAQYILRRTAPE